METKITMGKKIDVVSLLLLILMTATGFINSYIWPIFFLPIVLILYKAHKTKLAQLRDFRFNPADLAVLTVCLLEVLLLQFSHYINNSILATQRLLLVGVFWFFFRLFLTNRFSIRLYMNAISALVGLLSLLTLISYLKHRTSVMGIGNTDMTLFRQYYRPLGCVSNDWVTILLCMIPMPLYGLIICNKKSFMILYTTCLYFTIMAIMLSFSRGGYLSLLIFFTVTFILFVLFKRDYIKRMFTISMVLMVLTTITLIPDRESVLTTLSVSKTTVQKRSTDGRLKKWQESIELSKISPITGVGGGNYGLVFDNYIKDKRSTLTRRSTNTYLQILVEKGVVGIIVYGISIVLILLECGRSMRRSPEKIPFVAAIVAIGVREFLFSSFFIDRRLPMLIAILILLSIQSFSDNETQKK